MTRFKLMALLLLGLMALCIFLPGCEGDPGPQGPKGTKGDPGLNGTIAPPADRVFALAIFNGTKRDHNGANLVSLTFDSTALPSASVVVGNRISAPPVIDGIDEGTSAWGAKSSKLALTAQAFADNFIKEATVRAAYDDYNIYFQVKWTEIKSGNFVIGENKEHLGWVYQGRKFVLKQAFEDKLALMFSDSRSFDWLTQGCLSGCHLGDGEPSYMRTLSPAVYLDTWQWGSVRTNSLGIALDRALTSLAGAGFQDDDGIPPVFQNLFVDILIGDSTVYDSIPISLHRLQVSDTAYSVANPLLWDYYAVPYRANTHRIAGAALPGWIVQTPSEGNDLIKCKAIFSNGIWTVEFSRPRVMNDIFDSDF